MIDGARVLITGGTGSFGKAFVAYLLENQRPQKIVIFSRNEANQCEMSKNLGYHAAKMRFILGSVTNYERVYRALKGIDIVIHAAALKVVDKAEYNPLEVLDVNVDGTRNMINACIERGVKEAILIATDKGVHPVNLYGMTKGVAERVWLEANYLEPIFKIVRYGNVMGSRGSVINYFLELKERGEKDYPITHLECTRFWVDMGEAIKLVLKILDEKPGTILASKTKAFRIKDLIKAIYLRAECKVIGLRDGEKIHETLVNEYEAARTKELAQCYRIFPAYSFDDTVLYDREHGTDLKGAVVSNDPELLMNLDEVRAKVKAFEETHA